MTLCEFCVLQQKDKQCSYGHSTPKKMRCPDFTPAIERFCATPADYTGREQLRQMALFFGLAGKELRRVLAMSEVWREAHPAAEAPLTSDRG
ncbi:MAG TPA: hypothetical protein VFD58_08765 [Blastocatellia bacterium]|nr:hypothetical protein [Blastocatellia bacterium]